MKGNVEIKTEGGRVAHFLARRERWVVITPASANIAYLQIREQKRCPAGMR